MSPYFFGCPQGAPTAFLSKHQAQAPSRAALRVSLTEVPGDRHSRGPAAGRLCLLCASTPITLSRGCTKHPQPLDETGRAEL